MKKKLKFSFTEIVVAISIFALIIAVCGYVGYTFWKGNMAVSFPENVTYTLEEKDITTPVLYQCLTNSFVLCLIFILIGGAAGFGIDAVLMILYILLKLLKGFFIEVGRKEYFARYGEYPDESQPNKDKKKKKKDIKEEENIEEVKENTVEEDKTDAE